MDTAKGMPQQLEKGTDTGMPQLQQLAKGTDMGTGTDMLQQLEKGTATKRTGTAMPTAQPPLNGFAQPLPRAEGEMHCD